MTACEVCTYSWVVQSNGLFPEEFGGVVFEVGGGEKDSDWGIDFLEKIVRL